MKILFSSYSFAPNIGGIESVSAILAEKFSEAGHEVDLVTETEENAERSTPNEFGAVHRRASNAQRPISAGNHRITRRPSLWKLLRLLGRCELLFQNNISLRSLIPALLLRKRAIVVHQTWLRGATGAIGWNNRLKRALLPRVTNVAIGRAILADIAVPARVIGNPYDDRTFRLLPNIVRDKTVAFVGRLVSDKGVDLLLEAMKILQRNDLVPDLTITGSGPEEQNLRRLTSELGLDRQITFAGPKKGDELAGLLNQHRILVVPSRWPEPFGVVALEGIACGCVVVGSSGGGLPDAIGPCGLTFENRNATELAECLKKLLLDCETAASFRKNAPVHLAKFGAETIARAYLELMRQIL